MSIGHKCVMLKVGDRIDIGPDVKIQVIESYNKKIRVRISAPKNMKIDLSKDEAKDAEPSESSR